MSTIPNAVHRHFGWRLLPITASLALSLGMTAAPGVLWGQDAPAPSPEQPAIQFEVLDVTTGTGSKTQAPAINEAGVPTQGQAQGIIPAVPTALTGVTPAPPRILTPEEKEIIEKHPDLMAALENWHRQVMGNYRIDVSMLADPFLPIKEVRGTPEENSVSGSVDMSLPPILRLDLSQLKLVAITTFSSSSGSPLASFEDGAGNSYILRKGDRIGRNNGKIVNVGSSVVTIEETGRDGKDKPRVTDIRLTVLSREGLTMTED